MRAAPCLPAESIGGQLQSGHVEHPSEYGDAESDITGLATESEGEEMDIDAVLAGIPPSQKASVRSLLEAKRAKQARKAQRLKKPAGCQSTTSSRQSKKK
jgi:hypothetical protein